MHRDLWIKLLIGIIQITAAVVVTVTIMTKYYIRPIVVVDLQELTAYQKSAISNLKDEERIDYVASYFKKVSENIKNRNEIVVVKQAVLNPEHLKDITDELKQIK